MAQRYKRWSRGQLGLTGFIMRGRRAAGGVPVVDADLHVLVRRRTAEQLRQSLTGAVTPPAHVVADRPIYHRRRRRVEVSSLSAGESIDDMWPATS